MRIGIVLQGEVSYPDRIVSHYNRRDVILSTNKFTEDAIRKIEFSDIAIQKNSLVNPGRANFNNQVINTYNGILLAEKLGFEYVIKIRSDIFIYELDRFLSLIDTNSVYFSAYHNWDGGYLCEHMVAGPIDFMKRLWDIPESNSSLPPEVQLTNKFESIYNKEKIKFLFPILYEHDIVADWPKHQRCLNSYEDDRLFIYDTSKLRFV